MKKTRTVSTQDPRARFWPKIVADQLDRKVVGKTTAPPTGGSGGTGGGGQDGIIIPGTSAGCDNIATLGRSEEQAFGFYGPAGLSNAIAWDEGVYQVLLDTDEDFFSSPQTLLIKTRWQDIASGDQDRCFIEFRLSKSDVFPGNSYLIIKPTRVYPSAIFWNGGQYVGEFGTDFDEFTIPGDITDWLWWKVESTTTYIRVKIWQDGDSEPISWLSTASKQPGDPTTVTGTRFHDFTNNWALDDVSGHWLWQFGYFDLTEYSSPTDTFSRSELNGWGASDAGVPWTVQFADPPLDAIIEIDPNCKDCSASAIQETGNIIWEDTFGRPDSSPGPEGWADPPEGYWSTGSSAYIQGGVGIDGAPALLYTDSTTNYIWNFSLPVEYLLILSPGGISWNFSTIMTNFEFVSPNFPPFFDVEYYDDDNLYVDMTYPTTQGQADFNWIIPSSNVLENQWARIQISDQFVRSKVWGISESEPSDWMTLEAGSDGWPVGGVSLVSNPAFLWIWSASSGMGIGNIEVFDLDCSTNISSPDTIQVDGNTIPPASGVGVYAGCTRISSTQFELPTDASYIKTVYLDGVPINFADWSFASPRTLYFIHTIPFSSFITCRYVI